jgi:hypothetical protein
MMEQQHAVKASEERKRCSSRLVSSAQYDESWIARTSITEDASTRPLAERLKPEPSGTQGKVAFLSTLVGRMGTSEVSVRGCAGYLAYPFLKMEKI